MDREIRAGHYPNLDPLKSEFGVRDGAGEATIRFMRDSLQAPVRYSRHHKGYHYDPPAFALPTAFLTEGEVLAILLAEQTTRYYLGTPLEDTMRRAVDKLVPSLPDEVLVDLGAFSVHGPPPKRIDAHLLQDCLRAIRGHYLMRVRHYSPKRGQTRERVVEPHFLSNLNGDWALGAYDHDARDLRTFALHRIRSWALLDTSFKPRPEINARRQTEYSLFSEHGDQPYEVILIFDEIQARWARDRTFHPSQTLHERADGRLEVRFQTVGKHDILRLALSYGSRVEVIVPQWLRQSVAEEAVRVAAIYARRD